MSNVNEDIIIPSSPEDRKKIKGAIEEMNNSMTLVDAQREHQKAIVDRIHEELGFNKKIFRRMARDFHRGKTNATIAENEAYELANDAILGESA